MFKTTTPFGDNIFTTINTAIHYAKQSSESGIPLTIKVIGRNQGLIVVHKNIHKGYRLAKGWKRVTDRVTINLVHPEVWQWST
jgi:hypothetical protein